MFFALSTFADYVLLPSNMLGVLGVLSLAAVTAGYRRVAMAGCVLGLALLIIFGWSPLGRASLVALENRFPSPEIRGPVIGILMLGGAVNIHITEDRGSVALNEAGERITATAELAQRYPEARILLSGGAGHLTSDDAITESSLARDMLVSMGIPQARIKLEERSRNTCENATESRILAQPKAGDQWLLVTSASHMPRAVACFRAAEFEIVPYPVDYRTRGTPDLRRPVSSIALGLEDMDLAAHEWLGLLIYRMTKTRELFPGSEPKGIGAG